jgi:aryl-alcohol dehydrogenase-like predicted oxidoreductase
VTTSTTKEIAMQTRTLGSTGPAVSALGLGAMSMSGAYGVADRTESIATVHAALDAGVTLIDTADFYAMGHNELLLAEALRGRDRDSYTLSVKFGMLAGPGNGPVGYDGRPGAVKTSLAYSLTRLGVDHIDIYRPARLDPAVPIEETVGAIKEMIDIRICRNENVRPTRYGSSWCAVRESCLAPPPRSPLSAECVGRTCCGVQGSRT